MSQSLDSTESIKSVSILSSENTDNVEPALSVEKHDSSNIYDRNITVNHSYLGDTTLLSNFSSHYKPGTVLHNFPLLPLSGMKTLLSCINWLPSDVVLFPGSKLPLRLFNEKEIQLVRSLVDSSTGDIKTVGITQRNLRDVYVHLK